METTTTFSKLAFADIEHACVTPDTAELEFGYIDADDELGDIARFIGGRIASKERLDVDRIKFLYASKPKKEGGKYAAGWLIPRGEIERVVDDRYDYVVCVYYHAWKDFDAKIKVIQLDKILCGVDVEVDMAQNRKVKKGQSDIREFQENINYFGATEVIASSEIVDLATASAVDVVKQKLKGEAVDE